MIEVDSRFLNRLHFVLRLCHLHGNPELMENSMKVTQLLSEFYSGYLRKTLIIV